MKKVLFLLFGLIVSAASLMGADKKDAVKILTDSNYEAALKNPTKPLVIEFSATWCGPCKIFAPTYHEVAAEMVEKVDFYQVDVDQAPELAGMMRVQAVPTVLMLNPTTKKVDVIQGLVDKAEFMKRLKAIL